jgi:hypothetical protein
LEIIYWLSASIFLGDVARGLGEQEVICSSIKPLKVTGKADRVVTMLKLERYGSHNLAVSIWTQVTPNSIYDIAA